MPRKKSKFSERTIRRHKTVKRLYRSTKNKILGGVCGGIAEYFNVDPTIVRILWVLFVLLWGTGLLLYVILWLIMPKKPKHE